ncbi:AAA family ATPase [bacterium]|nr:MAG: AAA family ATPase [bacterium]
MSENKSISSHNSDLVLNSDLKKNNKEEKHIENLKYLISKKGASLGENNHLKSLHAFSLLNKEKVSVRAPKTKLQTSSDLNKTLISHSNSSTYARNQSSLKYQLKTKYSLNLFELNKLTKQEGGLSKNDSTFKSTFIENAEDSLFNKITDLPKHNSTQLDVEVVHALKTKHDNSSYLPIIVKSLPFLKKNSYLLYFKSFLDKINQGISLGISREFLFIAINLTLFSILTIVQRSNYGQNFSTINKKKFYTILFENKLPNLSISRELSKQYESTLQTKIPFIPKPNGRVAKISFLHQKQNLNQNEVLTKTEFISKPSRNENQALPMSSDIETQPLQAETSTFYTTQNAEQNLWSFFNPTTPDLESLEKQKSKERFNKAFFMTFPYKKQEQLMGVFLGQFFRPSSSLNSCKNLNVQSKQARTNNQFFLPAGINATFVCPNLFQAENEFENFYVSGIENKTDARKGTKMHNKFLLSIEPTKKLLSQCKSESSSILQQNKILNINSPQNRISFRDSTIKPWYCIKASNTWNNQILATRFTKQAANNDTLYKDLKIERSQYYIPYYTTQQRIFAESDTIPEKRGTIYSQPVKEVKRLAHLARTQGSVNLNRVIKTKTKQREIKDYLFPIASDLVLKRYFYKYGFFLIKKKSLSSKSEISSNLTEIENNPQSSHKGGEILKNDTNLTLYKNKSAELIESSENKSVFSEGKIKSIIKSFSKFIKNKDLLALELAWSKYNLEKVKIAAFVQIRDAVPTFNFIPDTLIKNTSVSGYQFPELQKKEIIYLFRKIAIFHFYLHTNTCSNKLITPFRSSFFDYIPFINKNVVKQIAVKSNLNFNANIDCANVTKTAFLFNSVVQKPRCAKTSLCKNEVFATHDSHKEEIVDLKMQYTQVDLEEIESVKELFNQMGKDYENYIRQPKDSLPALIISPSLEDDREIEDEGIQILRERDLIRKSNLKDMVNSNGEDPLFTKDFSTLEGQNNETQNHEILVKNALQQAQEEMDDLAKKEEKTGEQQKLPQLTRLEALYSIRDQDKNYEQAKDFLVGKPKPVNQANFALNQKSFPVFEELFLYSDRVNEDSLKSSSFVDISTPWLFSKLGDERNNQAQPKWRFALIRTDRKHSFFGEMNLPAHKLTAQEQKQVFQQKANPLLKLNRDNTKLGTKDNQVTLKKSSSGFQQQNIDFGENQLDSLHLTATTVPFSLLSPLSVSSKTHNKKEESPRFKVGTVQTTIVPPVIGAFSEGVAKAGYVTPRLDSVRGPNRIYFYDKLSPNKACKSSRPKMKGTPLKSPVSHRIWQLKRMQPSTFRVSPRNKSTPVIPQINQKDWKKMMEWQLKKHFFSEDKRLWKLSAFASTENVRLPFKEDNTQKNKSSDKTFKIKKVNLYFPWICIKKGVNTNNFSNKADLGLTFVDKNSNDLVNALHLPGSYAVTTSSDKESSLHSFWPSYFFPKQEFSTYTELLNSKRKNNRQIAPYWRYTTQQNLLSKNLPVNLFAQRSVAEKSKVETPKPETGVAKTVFRKFLLFESVTKYSWLFIYTFVFVLMFKQLFQWIYQVGLKDFFIKFLNSDFGRTVTSDDFRYSIQNPPLKEYYMPNKRLQELFSIEKNKVQLLEIVWFLRNHCQGRYGPRGVILVGPPGVENISVVQAIAGEAKVPIIVQSLQKIAQDYEPQRQLEQLYIRAQKQAPCVLFLDQLDTIGARRDQLFTDKKRANNLDSRANSSFQSSDNISRPSLNDTWTQNTSKESETLYDTNFVTNKPNLATSGNNLNVLLRLLTILDGITQFNGVVTVATARDLTKLDPALLRPKRFDRRIYLSLLNRQDRVHLFKIQTQNLGHIKEIPWDYLSLQTENMSVTEIQSAINYSLFKAVLKKSVHTLETLEYGIDCVKTLTEKRV